MSCNVPISFIIFLLYYLLLSSNNIYVKATKDLNKKTREEQWLADRNLFLDIDNARSDTIDNITDAFLSITNRLVKAGRLMVETKRRMVMFIDEVALQNLYHKMSRHPERLLPKQAKRDPEALVREKIELTQLNEANPAEANAQGPQ
ncbi:hypothetical protein QQG55_19885 [Brugia pahangi]